MQTKIYPGISKLPIKKWDLYGIEDLHKNRIINVLMPQTFNVAESEKLQNIGVRAPWQILFPGDVKVIFISEYDRIDSPIKFPNNYFEKLTTRVKEIQILRGEQILKKYTLSYNTLSDCISPKSEQAFGNPDVKSQLTCVRLYGSDGSLMEGGTHIFDYTVSIGAYTPNPVPDLTPLPYGGNPNNASGTVIGSVGDFNGDGISDFITFEALEGTNYKIAGWTPNGKLFLGQKDGTLLEKPLEKPIYKNDIIAATGDFNGDGLSDFLVHGGEVVDSTRPQRIYFANGDVETTFTEITIRSAGQAVGQDGLIPWNWKIGASGDFNGDGRADFLAYNTTLIGTTTIGLNGQNFPVSWRPNMVFDENQLLFLSKGDGSFDAMDIYPKIPIDSLLSVVGDFNGDGKLDFLAQKVDSTIKVNSGLACGGKGPHKMYLSKQIIGSSWEFDIHDYDKFDGSTVASVGDYNGDGRTDFISYTAWSKANQSCFRTNSDLEQIHLSNGSDGFLVVDVSGSDSVYCESNNWDDFVECMNAGYPEPLIPKDYIIGATGDFNGDGLSDFIAHESKGNTPVSNHKFAEFDVKIYYSNGDGTFHKYIMPNMYVIENSKIMVVGDLDGNGKDDFISFDQRINQQIPGAIKWNISGGFGTKVLFVQSQPDLLNKITTPLGGKLKINYKAAPISEYNAIFSTSTDCGGPDGNKTTNGVGYGAPCGNTNTSSRPLVSSVTKSNGRVGENNRTLQYLYYYENGRYLPGKVIDRENLGFERIKEVGPDGITTITSYRQDFPFHGKVEEVLNLTSDSHYISQTKYQYENVIPFSNVRFIRPTRKDENKYNNASLLTDNHLHTATKYFYQGITGVEAGIVNKTIEYADNLPSITSIYTKDSDLTNWVIGKLNQVTVQQGEIDGKNLKMKKYTYYEPFLEPKNECDWLDNNDNAFAEDDEWLCTTMEYDSMGRLVTSWDPNNYISKTYKSSFEYNSLYYPFLQTKKINQKLHELIYSYDVWGKVATETDVQGKITKIHRDTFGRVSKIVYPDGGRVIKQYVSFGEPDSQNIRTRTLIKLVSKTCVAGLCVLNGPEFTQDEYFDGFGFEYKTSKTSDSDDSIEVQKQQNNTGRFYRESLPYFTHEDPKWTNISLYDTSGRIESVTKSTTNVTNYFYNFNSATLTDANNNSVTTMYDARSRKTDVIDAVGVTHFEYDALGSLIKTNVAAGTPETLQTVIANDTLGRKTMITEPNTGKTQFAYDNNGNIKNVINAQAQQIYFFV